MLAHAPCSGGRAARELGVGRKTQPLAHLQEAVENIGSGIQPIRDLCRDHGVAEPEFVVSEYWVTTTFRRREERPGHHVGTELEPGRSPAQVSV